MIDLGRQLTQRIEAWRKELPRHLAAPILPVTFEGFTTLEELTAASAAARAFHPFPAGTKWGAKWEYGWFRASVTLPEAAEGKRVALVSGLGGEQLVFCDGAEAGSIDREHPAALLRRRARARETLSLLVESYAGHGPRLENVGPCPPERKAVPEPPENQCVTEPGRLIATDETAYQLWVDVETLWSLLKVLPDRSLRAQRVAKALEDFTRIADFELPAGERTESFARAREALAPALACRNGTTTPEMSAFGQSHIDLMWLWPLRETRSKVARTYANQLALMEEYPTYPFLACEPALLEPLRLQHPALWARAKDAFARGQLKPEGAFWVECDTNMPCGESLIRQLVWGKRWFAEHFGVDSRVAWQPDTFGFSAALPQLLRGCGVPYFATQKLLRQDPECEPFPYQNFLWEGIDGSTVLAHMFFKNNAHIDPEGLVARWERDRRQQRDIGGMLYPFGFGDGGGGAVRGMVESFLRCGDLEGAPRVRAEGPDAFFDRLDGQGVRNRWVGELYLAWHRGTYTAQRRTKALARRLELALREAEAAACDLPLERRAEPIARLRDAWATLLLHQFHDLAGGVGIARVHEEAERALSATLESVRALTDGILRETLAIAPEEGAWVVVNPLARPRAEWLRLAGGAWRFASAPAMGAATLQSAEPDFPAVRAAREDGGWRVENGLLSLVVDDEGCLISCVSAGRELVRAGGRMNDWRLYRDVNPVYDAWELPRDWAENRVERPFVTSVALTLSTPGVAELAVRRTFGESRSTQILRVCAGSRRVDFETEIDWRERHRLLKAHFESDVLCVNALHEIQFGHIERPAHRSHAYAADRYEVAQQRWSALREENRGFALLNDGVYGISSGRGELALTLLRAPLAPDDTCDRGAHRLTYSLYPFGGDLGDVIAEAEALNQPLRLLPGACAPKEGYRVERGTAVLETVKPADDGRGVVLRLYESRRASADTVICLPFEAEAYETDMLESMPGRPLGRGARLTLAFRPFEVKTIRLL